MEFSNGTYRILYIKDSGYSGTTLGDYYMPVACLTDNSINESTEMLNTTTRDNGGWASFMPTNQSLTISFTGIIEEGNNYNRIDFWRLKTLMRTRTAIEWKVDSPTEGSDGDSGTGYLTSLSKNDPLDDMQTFSGEIVGTWNITNLEGVNPAQMSLTSVTEVTATWTFVADILAGDETSADNDLTYRIYNKGKLYHTVGSHTSDANVTNVIGTVTIINVPLVSGVNYKFTITSVDERNNESVLSNIKDVTAS